MIKAENKKIKKLNVILLLIIIIILFLTGFSIGKEASDTILETKGEIAKPILFVDNNPEIEITAMKNKGSYYFTVKNYENDENITEVDMEYDIEIIGELDESIIVHLYQGEEEILLKNMKTEKQILTKDGKQEKEYRLEITYDKNKSTSITDIMQEIQVKVHAEQVKQGE